MSLLVYEQTAPGVYSAFSTGGTHTNPVSTIHHGRNGDIGREIGNSSTFTNIRIEPVSLTIDDDIGSGSSPGSTGWGVKLMVDNGHDPTESEWDATDYGNTIDIDDISSDTKQAFWFRIESPRGISIQNKKNIALTLMFTETP
jgi:hypothetical protein